MTSATNASPTVGERHLASDGWIGPKDTPGTASASEPFSGWVKQVRVAADGAWVHSRVITRVTRNSTLTEDHLGRVRIAATLHLPAPEPAPPAAAPPSGGSARRSWPLAWPGSGCWPR
jgi:hypothetical protein